MAKSAIKVPRDEKRNAHGAQGVDDSQDTFTGVRPKHRDLQREQLRESDGWIAGSMEKRADWHADDAKMSKLILLIPARSGN